MPLLILIGHPMAGSWHLKLVGTALEMYTS
jgi:hypothetical protein